MTPIQEAVILMAGQGSRLRGADRTFLKPFVLVGGRRLISYTLDALIHGGIRTVNFVVGYESERMIQDNMQRIAQGRTVFIIAHRLSTVRRSNRIITIDRGRLVEDGTHDELIKKGGRYATLHRVQADIHEVR